MKEISPVKWTVFFVGTLLLVVLLLGGCTNLTPVDPQPTPTIPPKQVTEIADLKVTYNYSDTGKVQLSANNLVLKVGQKLTLEPAPGLSTNTRFVSSGEYFIGNVMRQETDGAESNKVVFTAINPGKGILSVIPNTNETDRAVDLVVTVQ